MATNTLITDFSAQSGVPPPTEAVDGAYDVENSGSIYDMLPNEGVPVRRKKLRLNFDWVTDAFVRWFTCCIPDDIIEDMEDDLEVCQRVHETMLVVQESGHSAEVEAIASLNPPHTLQYDTDNQVITVRAHQRHARVQPKFVVQVVLALRCKLGLGAKDKSIPGNVELVRREAAKIMRAWGVRDHDASVHLRYVERCFFEETTHDRLPDWRIRAAQRGRLYRWLFKDKPPKYDC